MVRQSISRALSVIDAGTVAYNTAWDFQKQIFEEIYRGERHDTLILLEHPHTYTLGKVADKKNLIANTEYLTEKEISVVEIDRGGDITYHGPGQLVGYPIINLKNWKLDSHKYLRALEELLIRTCSNFSLNGSRIDGLTGVWIDDRKIAAIGIKISRWITMHGFAFNVYPALDYFGGIIPCGITDKGVTSLEKEIGYQPDMQLVKEQVIQNFTDVFEYKTTEINKIKFPCKEEVKEAN